MARTKTPYFNPCCCCTLKTGIWVITIWTILYCIINISIIGWRTAEISYKRERTLGTLKPYGYGDRYKYPGTYDIFYRSPEVRWYTAIFVINIIHVCVLFFLLCGGVTLIWGFKTGIRWLIWFYVVFCVLDILVCLGYAIAWWTSEIREPDQQITLSVVQVIFALINAYCLVCVIAAYRAMRRGYFVKRDRTPEYGPKAGRQIVVDHSFDYDPFGAVFIDPYQEPKEKPPQYVFDVNHNSTSGYPYTHTRQPFSEPVKRSVETHFNEPATTFDQTPPPLQTKTMPFFENEAYDGTAKRTETFHSNREEAAKFGRTPTPLPAKEDIPAMSENGAESQSELLNNDRFQNFDAPATKPINLEDLRLDYVPSEDSINPARSVHGIAMPPPAKHQNKEKKASKSRKEHEDRKKASKSRKHHRHHHSHHDKKPSRRERGVSENRDSNRRHSPSRHHSTERHKRKEHQSSRFKASDDERPRHHHSGSRDRGARQERDRNRRPRRSKSTDYRSRSRSRGHRRRESSCSSESSSSSSPQGRTFLPKPRPRPDTAPIVTRPSSGEDYAFAPNLNPALPRNGMTPASTPVVLPYSSDSDSRGRNLQINSEIQISFPPRPEGTAGTQLPLYTTSIPAPHT